MIQKVHTEKNSFQHRYFHGKHQSYIPVPERYRKRCRQEDVIPELNGKLIGSAQRVPTPTGSTTILTAVVEGTVTVDEINAKMKASATESFGYNTDEIVSSDIVGMRYGSLFDATQTMVLPLDNGTTEVQVVSWYDNENSYTSQMVRTIKYFSELA